MSTSAKISLPGKMECLYDFMDFVTSYAREKEFREKRINEIELAMEEILVNIIKYAYKDSDLDGNIGITCGLTDAQSLVVEISDSGMPFDILSTPEPDLNADIDERQIGGLGIFFVRQLMDDVQYRREDDQNKLTLVINNTD